MASRRVKVLAADGSVVFLNVLGNDLHIENEEKKQLDDLLVQVDKLSKQMSELESAITENNMGQALSVKSFEEKLKEISKEVAANQKACKKLGTQFASLAKE